MKKKCFIRFYGELKNLISGKQNKHELKFEFEIKTTTKDVVESFGIPHTEVSLILLNGESAGWNKIIDDNDRLSVFPFFYQLDIKNISKVFWQPEKLKFIADVHLGRLAKYLRILGFDCLYQNDFSDEYIIETSIKEKRIILTMDRGILKNSRVKYGFLVKSKKVKEQLRNVMDRFDLYGKTRPFSLCIDCNEKLNRISRNEASKVFTYLGDEYYKEFYRCPSCNKVYYKGSHYERMFEKLKEFLK
jgi:hypothetical protein